MKKFLIIFILLFPTLLFAQLNGTYTIGTSGNYTSFTAAVTALSSSGISGPVVFNIASGTYNEQIIIPPIIGADTTKTITFQSTSGDSSSVILTSSNDFTIRFDTSKFIVVRDITIENTSNGNYANVIILNHATDNKFFNNKVKGVITTSTNTNYALVVAKRSQSFGLMTYNNKFYSNSFHNGSFGFVDGMSAMYLSYGTEFINNHFLNQTNSSISIKQHADLIVNGNHITNSSTYMNYALNIHNCYGGCNIEKNIIKLAFGVSRAIYVDMNNSSASERIIVNNFIAVNCNNYSCRGIFLSDSEDIKILNNTIYLYGSSTNSRTLCFNDELNNAEIKNNIIANYSGGHAIYLEHTSTTTSPLFTSDYNNLISTGGYLAYLSGIGSVTNLSSWKSLSQKDSNSVSIAPNFYSNTDLHIGNPAMDNLGTPLIEVTDDIDGEPRDSLTPDIGADEFTIPAIDIGAVSAFNYPVNECYSVNETIKVRIKNYGISTLNFSIDTAIISANVTGVNPLTFIPVVISSDSLKPDSTMDILVSTNYNMSIAGNYTFNASTTLIGDGNSGNDGWQRNRK